MIEFNKAGGSEKLKEVAKQDVKESTKLIKELITYDIPQTLKKVLRDLQRRRRH